MPYPGYKVINGLADLDDFEPDFLSEHNPIIILGGRIYVWRREVLPHSGVYYVPSGIRRTHCGRWEYHNRTTKQAQRIRACQKEGELKALQET